jgi:mono/diheme cytochrome c family protein
MSKCFLVFGLLVSLVWAVGCSRATPASGATSAVTNGKNIYLTSESNSGELISYTGGLGMMRLACVNCHGIQGHGGSVRLMMRTFDVPSITWPSLTTAEEDRPAYTESTLKKAISTGVDSAGKQLKEPMPVWQLSDSDFNDLIAYIKTLR